MSKRKSIWDRPIRSAPSSGPKTSQSHFYGMPAPPPPPPIEQAPEPAPEPQKSRLDPPAKTRRKERSKRANVKSRTHTVTFSLSKEEHKLFKAKTKEMKTTFSGLVRTALYSYLGIDPLERPK